MIHEYELNITINNEELVIECEGSVITENDSFDHEFGTEKFDSYQIVEELKYDHTLYTPDQNKQIEEYITKNYNELSDSILKQVKAA